MRSKSNLKLPFSPLTSIWLRFWLPVARRVASKLATAPPDMRARKRTASSTVLLPLRLPRTARLAPLPAMAPPELSMMSRSLTKVSSTAPTTSVTSSPVMKRAMSTMCALRSPCAPLPASLPWKRQRSGVEGPPQSWR